MAPIAARTPAKIASRAVRTRPRSSAASASLRPFVVASQAGPYFTTRMATATKAPSATVATATDLTQLGTLRQRRRKSGNELSLLTPSTIRQWPGGDDARHG